LFAGLESMKLGHGGDSVLAAFLGPDPHALARRRQQLLDQQVTLIEFLLEYDTAGDPITGMKWSRRITEKIAMALGDFGVTVSPYPPAGNQSPHNSKRFD
jgi:hypothetical protein